MSKPIKNKGIKAWAVFYGEELSFDSAFNDLATANDEANELEESVDGLKCEVIPVLITPLTPKE